MKQLAILYFLGCGAVLLPQQSNAALIDMDWNTVGDEALMLDTTTGLQWLDLSITANQSYIDVISHLQQGGVYDGFRYATHAEVLSLWAHAGITDTNFTWTVNGEWQTVKDLADRLGTSVLFDPAGIATHALALVEGGPALNEDQRWAMELSYHTDGMQVRTSSNNYILDTGFASIHYSSYLVQAVPVPATIWLFFSGLLAMFNFSRSSKTRTRVK